MISSAKRDRVYSVTVQAEDVCCRPVRRSAINGILIITLMWLIIMGFQLIRSMRIDAYELTQSTVDLVGYWACFVLSVILGWRSYRMRRMMIYPIMLIFLLILYVVLIRFITAPSGELISFLFSRYGLVMWFILGIGFAAVLDILHKTSIRSDNKYAKRLTLLTLGCVSVPGILFSEEIVSYPVITLSYQAVATSATIYLLIIAEILIVVWGRSLSWMLVALYFLMATPLVMATALLQSTLIVAIYLGLFVAFIFMKLRHEKKIKSMMLLVLLLLSFMILARSDLLVVASQLTRFSVLFHGEELSSISSRQEIAETFFNQFQISPVFGHFEAEIASGAGFGHFVHSLPLSFLTHTGLVGTGMIAAVLVTLMRSRSKVISQLDSSEPILMLLMWIILMIGTIATFMTWPVFWFMLGSLCRRPMIDISKDIKCP